MVHSGRLMHVAVVDRDVASAIERRATSDGPGRYGFYHRPTRTLSWHAHRAVAEGARWFAARLAAAGARDRSVVVIACKSPEHIVTAYLGAVRLGAVPLVQPIRAAFDKHERIVDALRAVVAAAGPGVVVAHESGDRFGAEVGAFAPAVAVDPSPSDELTVPPLPARSGDDILHLQPTSGSTGAGKAVLVTHRNALANIRSLVEHWEVRADDRNVSWIPLYHDMGLITSVVLPLVTDTDTVVLSPFDFLADPVSFLRVISDVQGTMSCMPNFGFDLLARRATPENTKGLDLSHWRRASCGAEPIDVRTLRRFAATFAPAGFRSDAITTAYGLAEATLMATMQRAGERTRYARVKRAAASRLGEIEVLNTHLLTDDVAPPSSEEIDIVSVGVAGSGTTVWVADEHGAPIEEPGRCGEIVVAGASVSPGYREQDGSRTPIDPAGFATGDVGFVHDGELYIVERLKNVIIRNGENHSAQVIEQQLAIALDRPLDEIIVIDSDLRPRHGRITAFVGVQRAEATEPITAMVQAAQRGLSQPIDDLCFVPRGALPKTTSGKKQHLRLRQMLRDGDITMFDRVSLTPVRGSEKVIDLVRLEIADTAFEEVVRIARRRGFVGEVTPGAHLTNELGLDSLARIELAAAIETRGRVVLSEEVLGQVETVQDLLERVREARDRDDGVGSIGAASLVQSIASSIPQANLVVQEQHGRDLIIGDRAIADFASLNYLGLDQNEDVLASVEPMIRRWGSHPSWTRAVASPEPYAALERELAELVGAPDVVVFPTITLLHLGVLPLLAGNGTIFIDQGSHRSMLEAAELAQARGARIVHVRRSDAADLDAKLAAADPRSPRIVLVNGVYSMPGTLPDIPGYAAVVARHGATLYIDDAHGFGVLGANPDAELPYGHGGGGVVQHFGLGYENIVYVSGLSKAFSSMAAFVTVRNQDERRLVNAASTMIFSGPIPVASLATSLAGLEVNRREGDARRAQIHRLASRIVDGARELGFVVENEIGFPALTVVLGGVDNVVAGCRVAWEHGLLLTPAVFPAMPLERGGLRFSVTATNTDQQVDRLLGALADMRTRVDAPVRAARS